MNASLHDLETELTELIYSSLAGEAKWEDFLARLASVSPEGKVSLFFHDASCSRGSFALSAGFTDEKVREYNSHYSVLNPWMHKALVRPVGMGVVADQMLEHRLLEKTEFYNDFLKPMGTQSAVGVTIIRDHRRLFLLSVLTSQKDPDLNRPVADLLTRLTVHLQRAFQHYKNASLGSVFGEKDHMLASSNQTGFIIVGEGPKLKIISPMAEKMIELGYGIARSTTGKLKFKNPEAEAILTTMLGRFYEGNSYVTCNDSGVRLTFMRLLTDAFLSFVEGPTIVLVIEPHKRQSKQLLRAGA